MRIQFVKMVLARKTTVKAIIQETAMPDEMQVAAAESSEAASERYNTFEAIAKYIKHDFEKRYGNTWHCVAGTKFGR